MNVEQAKKAEKKMNKKYKNYSKLDMARMYSDEYGIVINKLNKNSKNPTKESYKNNKLEDNEKVIGDIEKYDINYGLLAQKDYYLVDVDLKDSYDDEGNLEITEKEAINRWNKMLEEVNIPRTTAQKSANGKGQHYIFKVTDHIKEVLENEKKERGLKYQPGLQTQGIMGFIDIRYGNGYVVGAGSTIDGKEYKLIDDSKVSEIPNELFDYLWERYPGKASKKAKQNMKQQKQSKQSKPKQPKADQQPGEEQQPQEETTGSKEVEMYKKLLDLIDFKYVDNYHTAISIIWSARSGSEELKETTHTIMSKSKTKYDREWVDKVWDEYEDRGITIKTALHYAKLSNSKEFMKIMKQYDGDTLDLPLLTDETLGNKFITLYGEDFLYYQGGIYKWNGVYWSPADRAEIIQEIYDRLLPYFLDIVEKKYDTQKMTDSKKIEEKTGEKKRALQIINKKMGSCRGAQDLAETIKIKMRKQTIKEKMNNNWNLFVFNNKVYDLKKADFVEPRRDQYMTLSTGYDYEEPKQEDIDKVKKFLREIIPDKTERNFYLKMLSTSLEGRKSDRFIISNGSGGNGKSILHECIGNALGNYALNINNVIFQKGGGKKDEPTKANIELKRFVKSVEPNRDMELDSGIVKEFTGGETITGRRLYSGICENINHGTFLMECNGKPKFDEASEAMQRRVIDFKFKVIFKDDIKKYGGIKNIKKANKFYDSAEFKNKMKSAWFYILTLSHKRQMKKEFFNNIPEEIQERTKMYLAKCGVLNSWLSDHLDKANDNATVLPLKKLYNKLKISDFWNNLPKRQRREFTFNYICDTIKDNPEWGYFYKERKKLNGIDYRNVLEGYDFVDEKDVNEDEGKGENSDDEKDVNGEEEKNDCESDVLSDDESDEEESEDDKEESNDEEEEEQQEISKEEQTMNEEEEQNNENDDESDSDDDDNDFLKVKHSF
jgi:P4 family phage/plasmid primase-like protien